MAKAIGSALVTIEGNEKPFKAALYRADQAAEQFGKKNKSIFDKIFSKKTLLGFTAATVGLIYTFDKITDSMDHLRDRALQLRTSAQGLQALDFAAQQTGVSTEALDKAISKMQQNIGKASPVFKALGLDVKYLATLSVDKQFEVIGAAIDGLGSATDKAAAGAGVFSKNYKVLNELLEPGQIQALTKEFNELGIVLTDKQLKAADNFNDAKNKFETIIGGFAKIATAEILPTLTDITKAIITFVKDSGGVRDVAIQFGQFINNIIQTVTRFFTQVLAKAAEIADKLQGLIHPFEDTPRSAQNKQNYAKYNDLRSAGVDQKDALARAFPANLASNSKPSNNKAFETLKTNLMNAGRGGDSEIASIFPKTINASSTAMKGFADSANKASKKLDSISEMIKGAGQSELQRILGTSGDEAKQYHSETTDALIRRTFEQASKGQLSDATHGLGSLQQVINSLGAKDTNVFNSDTGKIDKSSTAGLQGAFNELKSFIETQKNNPQRVDVRIEADKDGILKAVISSQGIKDFLSKNLEDRMLKEAVASGARF